MSAQTQAERRSLDRLHTSVVRPLMLVLLSGLLWGSVIAASFFWQLFTSGAQAASASLFPTAPSDAWAWVNLISALLATIAWLFVVASALASRAGGSRSR